MREYSGRVDAITRQFQRLGYALIPAVLTAEAARSAYEHLLSRVAAGNVKHGDTLVPDTPAGYADPLMERILEQLVPAVESWTGCSVFPTYSYFRVYQPGDSLVRHRDRPACEISLSVCIGSMDAEPWPLQVEGSEGPFAAATVAGEGLLYKGCECAHWREPLESGQVAQAFFHFVRSDGPNWEWKFDKRAGLGTLTPAAAASNRLERYWTTLGRRIEDQLAGDVALDEHFARVATQALSEVPAPEIDVVAMTDWALSRGQLPNQVNFDSGFGEPPLVVYQTPQFYLEVLFWFPSRTGIHGHAFNGAFRVLAGYSIQLEYEFTDTAPPGKLVRIGRLEPRKIGLLKPGDVEAIDGGDEFLHVVSHVGNPSLTLVARTYGINDRRQFVFFRCGFARLNQYQPKNVTRQIQVLRALRRARPELFLPKLLALLEPLDDGPFYYFLKALAEQEGTLAFGAKTFPVLEKRFGSLRPLPLAAIKETINLALAWNFIVQEPDRRKQLRLVLAEICPDQIQLHTLIEADHPGTDPDAVIKQWAELVSGAGNGSNEMISHAWNRAAPKLI